MIMTTNTDKNQVLEEFQTKLEEGIVETLNSDKWKEYLLLQSKFRNYSFSNCILIGIQCPHATKVAGAKTWNSMGRFINKGEKAIKILAPIIKDIEKEITDESGEVKKEKKKIIVGFRMVNVFDVSQTNGKDLPSSEVYKDYSGDGSGQFLYDSIMESIDIPVIEEELSYGGYFSPSKLIIGLNKNHSIDQKAMTLVHELGHYRIHELVKKGKVKFEDFLGEKNNEKNRYALEEVVVESVAFIVCSYFGVYVTEYAFEYVAGWSKGDVDMVKKVGQLVQSLSKEVIERVEKVQETKLPEAQLA